MIVDCAPHLDGVRKGEATVLATIFLPLT